MPSRCNDAATPNPHRIVLSVCLQTLFELETSNGEELLVSRLVAAAATGCSSTAKFDEIKLRFNFGKSLFFKGASEGEQLNVQQLRVRKLMHTKVGLLLGPHNAHLCLSARDVIGMYE